MKQLPSIWKTDLKRCFSLFGVLVWMILTWGLRIPKVTCQRHGYLGILWGSIPNTQKDWTPRYIQRKYHWCQFPLTLMRWWWQTWDSFKYQGFQMTNVFKQNFGTEFTTSAQSFATCFQAVGYSERDQPTIPFWGRFKTQAVFEFSVR